MWLTYQHNRGRLSWRVDNHCPLGHAHRMLQGLIAEFDLPADGWWYCQAGPR